MKYVKEFLKYFSSFPAFTANDARRFLLKNGSTYGYYLVFMHDMVKNGRVLAIGRGRYTLHDDPMMAGFAFSPFYYGLETALTHYRLWDYMTPISIVTTNRVRKSNITILGRNVTVRKLQKDKFFGYSMIRYKEDVYIPMADIEKTLIDSVYFHVRFDKKVYSSIADRIDRKKLVRYLNVYSGIVKAQVNGLADTPAH